MTTVSPEDYAEARRQGDLAALVLLAAGLTPKAAPEADKPPDPEPDIPRTEPGAWPISGPLPRPQFPAVEVDRAVAEYRAWELDGRPGCDTHCDCPNCRPGGTT